MKKSKKTQKKTIVAIEFDTAKAAKYFMIWLCEGGEQDYWMWQECRERKEDGNITAIDFDYNFKKHTVKTILGRTTEPFSGLCAFPGKTFCPNSPIKGSTMCREHQPLPAT